MHVFSEIEKWQHKWRIPSQRMLIGEFGLARETRGARDYLKDLLEIFDYHRWSWCAYAYREDAWDAMDYELGEDITNMLNRSRRRLFQTIADQLD